LHASRRHEVGVATVAQRCEMDLSIAGFKALNDIKWPNYLKMKKVEPKRCLRSVDHGTMIEAGEDGTFQNQVSKVLMTYQKA